MLDELILKENLIYHEKLKENLIYHEKQTSLKN